MDRQTGEHWQRMVPGRDKRTDGLTQKEVANKEGENGGMLTDRQTDRQTDR